MSNQKLEVNPIGGRIGAEISGLDLREPLGEATVAQLARPCCATR